MTPRAPLPPPLRILLGVLAALVVLVVLAWGAIAIFLPPARVRAIVEQELSATLERPVRFESASVRLFPPVRLAVGGFALSEPGGFGNGAAFQAREVALDLDVFALLGRKLVVRRLVLEGPAIHLVLRADGTTNFDNITKPAPPGAPAPKAGNALDLRVDELAIKDGHVLVDRMTANQRVAFGVESKLDFSSERNGTRLATGGRTLVNALALGPLSARTAAEMNSSLSRITWTIEHKGKFDTQQKKLALERVALAFGSTSFEASGLVSDLGPTPALDLKAKGANLNLGDILHALSVADARALAGISGGGRLDFDLAIRGRMAPGVSPGVGGTLSLSNAAFRYAGAPAGVEAMNLHATLTPDRIESRDISARVSGQTIKAEFEAEHFADPRVRFAVQGDLDLAAVAPMVAPRDVKLAGRAAVNVQGSGRAKDPGNMALSGRAKLANVTVESPQLPKRIENIQGDVSFSSQRATVTGLSMTAGKSSLTLDATVTRPLAMMAKPGSVEPAGIQFTSSSPYLDCAELLPAAGGAAVLPNARGGGRVAISRFKNGKLDVSNVTANVTLEPGVLTVPAFALDGYGGRVSGNASVDLRNPALPVTQVKARMDSVQADALLSAWTPVRGWIRAPMNTTLDLSVAGSTPDEIKRSLTAVGVAALGNGSLGPGPAFDAIAALSGVSPFKEVRFKDMHLPFRVERGRVVTNPAKLWGPYGDWTMIGAVGFDGALDYAVSISLPKDVVAALNARSALAAGALADDKGLVLLDLKVRGTAKSPKVDWDTKAMTDRLAGRASKALAEQQAKLEAELKKHFNPADLFKADTSKGAHGTQPITADSLSHAAKDLFKGFFGTTKKSPPPPAQPPAPVPAPTPAPPDTTPK